MSDEEDIGYCQLEPEDMAELVDILCNLTDDESGLQERHAYLVCGLIGELCEIMEGRHSAVLRPEHFLEEGAVPQGAQNSISFDQIKIITVDAHDCLCAAGYTKASVRRELARWFQVAGYQRASAGAIEEWVRDRTYEAIGRRLGDNMPYVDELLSEQVKNLNLTREQILAYARRSHMPKVIACARAEAKRPQFGY